MTNPALNSSSNSDLIQLQNEVQRKLGACMIRVQQYEQLMKSMLAGMALEGTPEQFNTAREQKVVGLQNKTLGTLVKEFSEDYMTSARPSEPSAASQENESSTATPWFQVRHQMAMTPDQHQQIKTALTDLTNLRNDLVHHFVECFKLEEESGCQAAEAHLDASYMTVNDHYLQLKGWAASMDNARALMSSLLRTPTFENLFINGIDPDGVVDWPASGIVQALREAEVDCALDGWTLLDSAIDWMSAHHPDQTPAKYSCKLWRQVLNRSGQFDVLTNINPATGRGQNWFQSRPQSHQG